jgi:hypothetical protein
MATTSGRRVVKESAGEIDGPLSGPLKHNCKRQDERGHTDAEGIERFVRKYAAAPGLDCGYSAHSMRATFIPTALESGAAGRRDGVPGGLGALDGGPHETLAR